SMGGAAPSAKSLAAVVGPLFEAERSAMHKLIEQQIAAVQRGVMADTTAALPRLVLGEARTSSGQYIGDPDERSRSGHTPAAALGTSGAAKLKPSGPSLATLAAVGAAILIGGSLAWFSGGSSERAAEGQPQPAATASTATTSAVEADVPTRSASVPAPHTAREGSVLVEFHISPSNAVVTLDGANLPMPFSGELPRSAMVRRIEVTAAGYRPFHKLLAFDQNRRIDVVLEPAGQLLGRRAPRIERAQPAPTLAAAVVPQPTAAVSAAPQPAPASAGLAPGSSLAGKPRVRRAQIDVADPYAN
ncbi:MAG TPA: hypothetical protein VFZ61_07110, partial [Polyangiales bacterium]